MNEAIEHLATYGYCLLEERLPRPLAQDLAARCLELHADPANADLISAQEGYETLFGMPNLDDRVWSFASHPDVLAVAQHFLGTSFRAVEACSKPLWPGAPAQHLHVDSSGRFHQVPDVPWMINTIWMLTDFTAENGATQIVPMSHRSGCKSPPPQALELTRPVTGKAGSVMLWHGGAFHGAGPNTSDQIRIGLNIAYYPSWFNNWVEGMHQPIWPETYARMPAEIKRLWPGRQGKSRQEVYEVK